MKVFDKTEHFLDRSQSAVDIESQAEINAGVICGLGVFPQVELDRRQSMEQIASIGIGDGPLFRPLQVLVAVEHWEILTQSKTSSAALIKIPLIKDGTVAAARVQVEVGDRPARHRRAFLAA